MFSNLCIPMINARVSLFIEDVVVGCDQVTEPYRAWYVDFGVSSVRSSRNFGPLAHLAMRAHLRVRKYVVFPIRTTGMWRNWTMMFWKIGSFTSPG